MFAFVIWDERRREAFAARDRLGIKPLYWLDDGKRFAVASEIKGLLPLVSNRDIDPVALSHYLTFVAVPAPRTLFAGISKLAPASTLLVREDGSRVEDCYWDPLSNREHFDGEVEDWATELLFRLERSIDRRMMSDVPVGVFLSGGVDSSTNVALMSRLAVEPLNTFSIGYEGSEDFNEFSWARRVAQQFDTHHHELTIDAEDLWRFLPDLAHHQDEPIADPVCVPLYFVSKLAKERGVTVAHVGEGADELFAGYPSYVQALKMQDRYWPRLRALPRPIRLSLAGAGTMALRLRPDREIHVEALRRAAQPDGHLWWGGAIAFYERGFYRITTSALRRELDGARPREIVAGIRADADRLGARDDLDRLIYQDLRLRLPELLLMRIDKLTMANSVEARVPFLDHEIVQLAMAIPSQEKIRDGVGKHLLKCAVTELLPEDLVWRPKQGFNAPVRRWFRGELGARLEARLRSSALNDLGYLDQQAVSDLVALHRSGRADRAFQLWNLLNLAEWVDHWLGGHAP
jgi:asparagine synthase (glutamine-hydrolysing)